MKFYINYNTIKSDKLSSCNTLIDNTLINDISTQQPNSPNKYPSPPTQKNQHTTTFHLSTNKNNNNNYYDILSYNDNNNSLIEHTSILNIMYVPQNTHSYTQTI